MCLAQGHNAVFPGRLKPGPLDLKSSTPPLSHCAFTVKVPIKGVPNTKGQYVARSLAHGSFSYMGPNQVRLITNCSATETR